MAVPVVSIIGLPNVGKSTLFNRIIGKRMAIVDDTPGVTRDRLYSHTEWNGRPFYLIDTGGFLPTDKSKINIAVMEQAGIALEESDIVLYLIDGRVGPMPDDYELVQMVRKYKRKVLLVVNKMDNTDEFMYPNDYFGIGLGEPLPVSGLTGRNSGDLLDRIIEELPASTKTVEEIEGIRIAVLGRPNVGKSSLVNALLGYEKLMVDDVPGTTRDSTDSYIKYYGSSFVLIDTAGLRKKAKVHDSLEYYTVLRTMKSIERADICLLLIDTIAGMIKQDLKIADQILEAFKPMIIVVNKWDLLKGKDALEYRKEILFDSPELKPYPLFFTSAITKQRLSKLLPLVKEVYQEYNRRVPTPKLNDVILPDLRKNPPPAVGGKFINFFYITQYEVRPPSFMFSCNRPKNIAQSYLRYIINRMRHHFGFTGCPIKLKFKEKSRKE